MRGLTAHGAGARLVRPLARAADGIAHNRERRRTIRRYRRVQCVVLVPDRSADSMRDT
jgi:hypothetical protein